MPTGKGNPLMKSSGHRKNKKKGNPAGFGNPLMPATKNKTKKNKGNKKKK